MTQVSDVMTRGVRSMRPSETLMQAAQAMDELNVGAIPVCDGDTLVGIVTDRDIVLRGRVTHARLNAGRPRRSAGSPRCCA